MKERNTGKYLEALCASVEKITADNPTTQITRNKKIPDKFGIDREIDIYVEFEANRRIFKYAIECKQYTGKKKVDIADMVAFCAKIENQGIKGIFVTTTDYTAKAALRAEKEHIEIYKIVEQTKSSIKETHYLHHRHYVHKAVLTSKHCPEKSKKEITQVYVGASKKRHTLEKFMVKSLIQQIQSIVLDNMEEVYKVFKNDDTWLLNKTITTSIGGSISNIYFQHNKKFYPFERFKALVDLWIEHSHVIDPQSYTYVDVRNGTKMANFFSKAFTLNDNIKGYLNYIERDDGTEGEFDFVTLNPHDQKNVVLSNPQIYQPGELQIKLIPFEEE